MDNDRMWRVYFLIFRIILLEITVKSRFNEPHQKTPICRTNHSFVSRRSRWILLPLSVIKPQPCLAVGVHNHHATRQERRDAFFSLFWKGSWFGNHCFREHRTILYRWTHRLRKSCRRIRLVWRGRMVSIGPVQADSAVCNAFTAPPGLHFIARHENIIGVWNIKK